MVEEKKTKKATTEHGSIEKREKRTGKRKQQ